MPSRPTPALSRVALMVVPLATIALILSACGFSGPSGGLVATSAPPPPPSAVYNTGVVGNGFGPKLTTLDHEKPALVAGIPGTVVQVATSNSDTYALTASGAVWAWGAGSTGELGDGSRSLSAAAPVKVAFPAGVRIASLANPMPYDAALAIDASGQVWGWGFNVYHTLCLPRTKLLVPERLPLSGVTLATGAGDHSLFYARHRVYACGLGRDGELGNGSSAGSATPRAVVGLPAGQVTALLSSWQGSGALMANGSYFDWGFNRAGQLGNGLRVNSDVPVRVHLPGPVREVFQGGSRPGNGQSLALLRDGSVWAWGNGSLGQLGVGSTRSHARPVRVRFAGAARIKAVCSGGDSSYALGAAGTLWAWGGDGFGQLGNGRSGPRLRPVPAGITFQQISATATNFAGLKLRS